MINYYEVPLLEVDFYQRRVMIYVSILIFMNAS